jgi:hypothetical protein
MTTTIEHTPLDPATLSAAAKKALGPGPARMMASRGLVPLPPSEQITVLYQLAIDADQNLATAARTTAMGLPDKLLAGALADANVDARVLDLFAQLHGDKAIAFEALVGNMAVGDPTIAYLAENGGPAEVDRIATNEQRLLRHPEIIAAMYQNKHARMSTVDRIVELAVRNNVRVPGLAAWDEIARALSVSPPVSSAEADALFALAADATLRIPDAELVEGDADQVLPDDARDPLAEKEDLPIDKLSVPGKIRLATLGNAVARGVLIRDPIRIVAVAAIKAPGVTEFEAARYASNQSLPEDVIRHIASRREWTKLYGIKYSLCRNPKTPVTEAMRMLPFLREKDLVVLSKSKGVPSAVVAQARKLMMQRGKK